MSGQSLSGETRSGVRWRRWLYLASLMLAGESIYMLPYMRRTFQTSMEQVLHLSGTQVGTLDTMFGLLALACYFPGGWLADRFTARRLLTFSLLATGIGGFYMASLPGYAGLLAVHAFWGVTSILTFWAALIKATRNWGADDRQGTGFGLLDGGRGAVAAILASAATFVFALSSDTGEGLVAAILVYSAAPIVAAAAVWFVVPDDMFDGTKSAAVNSGVGRDRLRRVVAMPRVWLLALVILSAYFLYIGAFDFPGFAERAFGQSKVFGAELGTFRDWLRPVAAIAGGLLADRIGVRRTIIGSYVILTLSYGALAVMPTGAAMIGALWLPVALVGVGIFALRGLYFAVMEEVSIPPSLTGTTVGLVSVVGFAPDIFGHLVAGWFVDRWPGAAGYQYYFSLLAVVALVGLAAGLGLMRRNSGRKA